MSLRLVSILAAALMAACSSSPPQQSGSVTVDAQKAPISKTPTPTKKTTAVLKKGGGFYKDDGPAEDIPDGLDDIPDAEPPWPPSPAALERPISRGGGEMEQGGVMRRATAG